MGAEITAILFDMDGVLWDSTPCHAEAYRQVLAKDGISDFEYGDYAGMRTLEALRVAYAKNSLSVGDAHVRQRAAEKSTLARTILETSNPVVTGLRSILATVRQRYKMALASSASEETVRLFLRMNSLESFFSAVVHGGMVRNAKPDPEIFLAAGNLIGSQAKECLVIEDAPSGIRAATAAGMRAWGVAKKPAARAILVNAGAETTLPDVSRLPALLDTRPHE